VSPPTGETGSSSDVDNGLGDGNIRIAHDFVAALAQDGVVVSAARACTSASAVLLQVAIHERELPMDEGHTAPCQFIRVGVKQFFEDLELQYRLIKALSMR
jgi:hypothetical protein